MSKKYVLDSSALLALLYRESGSAGVASLLSDSLMSPVNAAEVLTKLLDTGIRSSEALEDLVQLGIDIAEFHLQDAAKAAQLRKVTKHLGLSLGDRACLALGIRAKAIVVTADRSWAKLKLCPIQLIR